MKRSMLFVALASAMLGSTAVQAGESEFDGSWIGGKIGSNRSNVTGVDTRSATTYGLEGGHNWNMDGFLLGVNGFIDSNSNAAHAPAPFSYGSSAYGIDAKLGIDGGNWMPYAKIGYARTNGNGAASNIGGSAAHLGLGIEYKFAPQWSVAGEYTTGSGKNAASKLNNDNFTIGVNYYFDTPKPVVVPPKEEVKQPTPPAPQADAWKTLLEEKPVTIDGANFDTDSAKLRDTAIPRLNEVVSFASKYPDAHLQVGGHTDSRGSKPYNQKLSEKRAASVKKYLVNNGVDAARISTSGYGMEQPVADNKTAEGRAQNRRVEIRSVVKEEKRVRVTK
ncbi:MAG: OmpA family protein [Gallionella sp.]|nr:OmpA family protein [Gallionella sp.]